MAGTAIDRAASFAARHKKALSIAGAIWFWAGIAVYARFIDLPQWLPGELRPGFFWLSVAFNAVWWGFAQPWVERRMAGADNPECADGEMPNV